MALFAGLGWLNLRLAQSLPLDTDFLVNWSAVRTFATQSLSPYSAETSAQIETLAYGRPALRGEPRLIFHLPLYGGLIYLPLALIGEYALAKALWLLLLELALLVLVGLSIRLCDWEARPILRVLILLYAWLGLHSLQALTRGSGLVVIGLLFVLAVWALRSERDDTAGLLLALATFQPEPVVLGTVLILLWTASHRRWATLVWFFSGVLILSIISLFFLPNWWLEYLKLIWNERSILPELSPVRVFSQWWPGVGRQLGWGLSLLMLGILLREWIMALRQDFRWFLWVLCLTLSLSPLTGVPSEPSGFVLLLLPLMLVLSTLEQRAERVGLALAAGGLLLPLLGLWGIFLSARSPESARLLILFPLPFFLLLGLYWVRWWFIHPRRLYIEELRANETLR